MSYRRTADNPHSYEITLTEEQQAVVDKVLAWWRLPAADRGDSFVLYGYAGTGKTTLARWIADAIDAEGGKPVFAAYTGKAASVLSAKIRRPTCTLHRLLYDFCGTDEDGDPIFSPKEWSEVRRHGLFIIDECSMVPGHMMEKALRHGVPILAVGDPAQLPPVRGEAWFHQHCDAMLETIHRQAADNPLIIAAHRIRQGDVKGGRKLLTKIDGPFGRTEYERVDQILCYTNFRRRRVNENIRRMAGRISWVPEPGEKLVGLRNNRDIGVLNGEMYVVESAKALTGGELVQVQLEGFSGPVIVYAGPLRGDDPPREPDIAFAVMDWGYCITVHKAQGSEWPRVVLFNDHPRTGDYHRWLYTAVTRASEELIYVSPHD